MVGVGGREPREEKGLMKVSEQAKSEQKKQLSERMKLN